MRYLLIALLSFLMISCSLCCPVSDQSRVIKLVPALQSETVALVLDDKTYCVAEWINETQLISAGHCVITDGEDDENGNPTDTIDKETFYYTMSEMTNIGDAPTATHHAHQIKLDREHDLVIIQADGPIPSHMIVSLAEKTPEVGTHLLICGHPAGIQFTIQDAMVSGYRTKLPSGKWKQQGPYMQLDGSVYYGDSGSGAFTLDGALVGIGHSISPAPNTGFYIHLDTIKQFLSTTAYHIAH